MTPTARFAAIKIAADALPDALLAAAAAMDAHGPTDPRTLRAWELVEVHGATIHRQSRLLAGKSKGG
jgi:hypothetical protein